METGDRSHRRKTRGWGAFAPLDGSELNGCGVTTRGGTPRQAGHWEAEREWVDGRDAHVEDLGRKVQLVFQYFFLGGA